VASYGLEADRHLLRCLFSHVDFSAEGSKNNSSSSSSSKDFHQIQLLAQECVALLTKPTLISNLCYALDNPLHHQKVRFAGSIFVCTDVLYGVSSETPSFHWQFLVVVPSILLSPSCHCMSSFSFSCQQFLHFPTVFILMFLTTAPLCSEHVLYAHVSGLEIHLLAQCNWAARRIWRVDKLIFLVHHFNIEHFMTWDMTER
jgi:hypothetical protein